MLLPTVCASSQKFAGVGSDPGETGTHKYGIFPTNDKKYVLVADHDRDRILRYNAENLTFAGEYSLVKSPLGLAQAPGDNGLVFAACDADAIITRIDPATGSAATVPVGLYYGNLAAANSGIVYGADLSNSSSQVTRWASDFSSATSWKTPMSDRIVPFAVAVDPRTGNVIATDLITIETGGLLHTRVVSFKADGTYLGTLITVSEPAGVASGVAVDANGNVYLAVYGDSGKLLKFDSSGRLLGMYGGALSHPVAVAVDSRADGLVWVYVVELDGVAHKITCM
jgi:DNA-binding beta-propeller fold protein YncE